VAYKETSLRESIFCEKEAGKEKRKCLNLIEEHSQGMVILFKNTTFHEISLEKKHSSG
jgi:hypothetical protein